MGVLNTILIVDDAEVNRVILRGLFENEYNLLEAENGEQALMLLRQYSSSIAVILLDLVMPIRDGYQVMEEIKRDEELSRVPVIVITSDDTKDSRMRVFSLGAADIIAKPFEPDVIKSRVRNIVELTCYRRHMEELVAEQTASLRESNSIVVDMLSSVIEYRSLESGQHIRRIRMFTKILLEEVARCYREYDLDERKIQMIADASSMHDIGKIAIPDRILNKPGRLSPEEFEVMKTHVLKVCEILSGLNRLPDKEYLRYAYNICRYHHERWDGGGYPDGLKGDNIPICAQVVAIADCYDALTTNRVYKEALSHDQAFNMILNGECGVFSPNLLECFKNVLEQFAALSHRYADGMPSQPEREDLPPAELRSVAENTLDQAQMKYFTLLRYADSTVMEVDLSTGIYHVVYLADKDFESLRTGTRFAEAIRAFAETAVHPDDREKVLDLLGGYMRVFLDQGLLRRSQEYRVLNRMTGEYCWCQVALLRVNEENPRQRKVMLVWHKTGKTERAVVNGNVQKIPSGRDLLVENLLGGILKCVYDQYFTIIDINPGLIDMLGYTEEEIRRDFGSRFMDFVFPPDHSWIAAQMREQLKKGRTVELEYRLVTKDGRLIWVIDRCVLVEENGREYVYCIQLDITKSKLVEEELRRSLERHKIIMDQTNDIIFEWDIAKDELQLSSNWEKKFGFAPITKFVSVDIPRVSHINPDDVPAFMGLVQAMSAGIPYKEAEFRLIAMDGRYRWCRVRATAQYDDSGKPIKAVGVLVDIDSQKRASAELEAKAERDLLTKLYNKETGRAKIEQHIKNRREKDLSALMVIDVDNFKLINDRYGHMFGDAVLAEISAKITSLFRSQDIICRIGGDEFLVFMPVIPNKEIAARRAGQMIESFRCMLKENLQDTALSCSVGLAYLSGGGVSFQTLFSWADRALYRAKAAGKNRYMRYERSMDNSAALMPEELERARTKIDSDQMPGSSMGNFISVTFEQLYGAEDLDQAVQSVLEMIGRLFNVSRVYIFENAADDRYCDNTFEWCNAGISPQLDILKNVPYIPLGADYRKNFNEDGVFYCPDIRKLPEGQRAILENQGIRSVLQCSIEDEGVFKGFVGLDDCRIQRLWTKDQIEALTFVAKMMSTFLLKKRTQEALFETIHKLYGMLDHQKSWIYVIDPETYRLLYANQKTKELVPEATLGEACYKAFYHRESPCVHCPLAHANETGTCTMERYNPVLKAWCLVDIANVCWGKQKACLLNCRDITAYKAPAGSPEGKAGEKF